MINRRDFLKSVALTAAVAGLGACATDQPLPGPVPQVGFAHLDKLSLRVGRVEVSSAYKSPMTAPNAEQRMPTSPERAMLDWARARLAAGDGRDNPAVARFVIEDAAVIETKLSKTEGLKGMLTNEPTERYDARAVALLAIEDPIRGAGEVRVTARRSIEVSENATLAAREQRWFELVEKLMADFDSQMEDQIGRHLGPWLMP